MKNSTRDIFATTRWTIVLKVGGLSEGATATAWQQLCKIYWYPLYVYARRAVTSREDAEDIVQGFLSSLFEYHDFTKLTPVKGRFRAYLLAALKHYISHERLKAGALKRGGKSPALSLDWEVAGRKYELMDTLARSPDEIYDREWALALLQNVLERLKAEWKERDRESLFLILQVFLTVDKDAAPYAETAVRHGFSETYLRVNTHRLRKRYRELLREEISQTLENSEMVEDEIRALFRAFS